MKMLELNWNKGVAKDPVKLADYIELTLTIDEDHFGDDEFTYAHFVSLIQDEPYVGNQEDFPTDEPDEDSEEFLAGEEMDETLEYYENAVSLIVQRSQWLGDQYPFSGFGQEVRFAIGKDKSKYMPYIFLLICSHHQIVCPPNETIKGHTHRLAVEFEQICKEAMKPFFNEQADVFLFSQFSNDRSNLGRSAREAVRNLATKLNTVVKNEDDIPDRPNEFGIDIAAIDALDDPIGYPFFAFAQCTISQDWQKKKEEAQSQHALSAYIDLQVSHSNLIFIPYLPRLSTNRWSVPLHYTINCIILDRYRICKMLQRLKKFESRIPEQNTAEILNSFTDRVTLKWPAEMRHD